MCSSSSNNSDSRDKSFPNSQVFNSNDDAVMLQLLVSRNKAAMEPVFSVHMQFIIITEHTTANAALEN